MELRSMRFFPVSEEGKVEGSIKKWSQYDLGKEIRNNKDKVQAEIIK